MEKQNLQTVENTEKSGEDLLQEYFNQDKEDKHNMGYSIYSQTSGGGGCC